MAIRAMYHMSVTTMMLEVIDLLSAEYFMPKMIVLMKWEGSYRMVIASDPLILCGRPVGGRRRDARVRVRNWFATVRARVKERGHRG